MSETKWTPGPWEVADDTPFSLWVRCPDGKNPLHSSRLNRDQLSNARLISAAPELYEAVVKLRRELELIVEWNSTEKKALRTQEIISIQKVYESSGAALAKARGEQ